MATIELTDGRRLGYACWGDPSGRPVVLFHGLPGSRLQGPPDPDVLRQLGLRLITCDRPGFGLSDPKPGRTLLDWPADVGDLLTALGLERPALLGVSGGAPYALACAKTMPERFAAIGLVSGLGPPTIPGGRRGVMLPERLLFFLARRVPGVLRLIAGPWQALGARQRVGAMHLLAPFLPPRDVATLDRPDVRRVLAADFAECFRQGTAAALTDLRLDVRPWPFDPTTVAAHLFLWHGQRDTVVSPVASEYLAANCPATTIVRYPDDGHYMIFDRLGEILTTLRDAN